MPFPKARVIPDNYSQHHRPVATGTMTGVCDLLNTHDGPAPYPLPEGWNPDGAPLATDVPCGIIALTSAQSTVATQQSISTREYQVTVPIDTPEPTAGEGGTIIKLTACDDPGLIGRLLRVIDVQYGTEVFERILVCTDNLTQNNPD